jgi:hypothetical protein
MGSASRRTRAHKIQASLTEEEWKKMNTAFEASSCQYLSEYFRLKLFDKTITMNYRNKSLDDFISQLILLRVEFHDFAERFSTAEQTLQNFISKDPKTIQPKMQWEHTQKFFEKLDEIKQCINQFSDLWSQELIL